MKILVVDVGGTHVKVLVSGRREPIKIDSGRSLTPARMVKAVRAATLDWKFDAVSIGYPGVVEHGRVVREPFNLGAGWKGFNFKRAFGRPVKVINDAGMQALGSYNGGRMLFLGLGTGLGSALVVDDVLVPMELAHLPYKKGMTYEDYLGLGGLERMGKKKWRGCVADVVERFKNAFAVEDVVLGGGNARLLKKLLPQTRLGANANAFLGGFRLWQEPYNGKLGERFIN